MYSENLRRAQVLRALDRFRSVVVIGLRPDPRIRPPFKPLHAPYAT